MRHAKYSLQGDKRDKIFSAAIHKVSSEDTSIHSHSVISPPRGILQVESAGNSALFMLTHISGQKPNLDQRSLLTSTSIMNCFAPPFFPSAKTIRSRVSTCNRRTPAVMSQFNAGEDYMRQLANQSTENARRRQQAAAANPTSPPLAEDSEYSPYLRDGINAGEEYIRALAAKSAGAPEIAEDVGKNYGEKIEDPVAAQLEALNREAEMLEKAIAAAENIPTSAVDVDIDQQISALEGRLDAASSPTAYAPKVENAMTEYERMRADIERHVTPDMQHEVEEENGLASDQVHHMRSGMIEMRLEVERFSNEMKLVQEKHDSNMKRIVDTYMPDI